VSPHLFEFVHVDFPFLLDPTSQRLCPLAHLSRRQRFRLPIFKLAHTFLLSSLRSRLEKQGNHVQEIEQASPVQAVDVTVGPRFLHSPFSPVAGFGQAHALLSSVSHCHHQRRRGAHGVTHFLAPAATIFLRGHVDVRLVGQLDRILRHRSPPNRSLQEEYGLEDILIIQGLGLGQR
jgi:hypothetical protein